MYKLDTLARKKKKWINSGEIDRKFHFGNSSGPFISLLYASDYYSLSPSLSLEHRAHQSTPFK